MCNLDVIDSLHDDQKVEVPLSICYLNDQLLRNRLWLIMANYVVSQGMDVLTFVETALTFHYKWL